MNETPTDTSEALSRWQKFQRTVVWEYFQVIAVAFVLVFGFIRPFVLKPLRFRPGQWKTPCLSVTASLCVSLSTASQYRGRKSRFLIFINRARAMCSFSFHPTRKRKTSSNASSLLRETPLKQRGTHSMSMANPLTTKTIPNTFLPPNAIFPHLVLAPAICRIMRRMPIIRYHPINSSKDSQTENHLPCRKVTSLRWAIIGIRVAIAVYGGPHRLMKSRGKRSWSIGRMIVGGEPSYGNSGSFSEISASVESGD